MKGNGWRVIAHIFWTVAVAYEVEFVVTNDVLGAQYPVDVAGLGECSLDKYASQPCECDGGAARRVEAIKARKTQAIAEGKSAIIALDLGGFFSGSGLFFPAFEGEVAAELFESSGYDVRALSPRDFAAGVNDDDPTGGVLLGEYLRRGGPPAIATNLDLSNEPYLNDTVAQIANITLFDRGDDSGYPDVYQAPIAAILTMIDEMELRTVSPYYADRLISPEQAMVRAFREMSRWSYPPQIIVVTMSGDQEEDLLGAPGLQFVYQYPSTTAVIVDGALVGERSVVHELPNWADETVAIASIDDSQHGTALTNVTIGVKEELPFLQPGLSKINRTDLDCYADEDAVTREVIDAYKQEIDNKLGDWDLGLAGYVWDTVDGSHLIPGQMCTSLAVEGVSMCGCAVAECPAGDLVADALAWYVAADVGFVPCGAIQASLFKFDVLDSHLLEMLPDIGDEIVRLDGITGPALRVLLQHSFERLVIESHSLQADDSSSSEFYGDRFFLQISSRLQVTWYYLGETPTVGERIYFDGELLSDDAEAAKYSLAVSSRFLGDDFAFADIIDVDDATNVYYSGVTAFRAVSAYLSEFYSDPDAPLRPDVEYPLETRISQTADVALANIVVLCDADSESAREQCDHALFTVDMLNDRDDGYYDDLAPSIQFIGYDLSVGCARALAYEALVEIARELEIRVDAVITGCSDDAAELADEAIRARFSEATGQTQAYVVIATSTTASILEDDATYPFLVRLATPENEIAHALGDLVAYYGWQHVAIVHDDSQWAASAAAAFADVYAYDVLGGGACVGDACRREIDAGGVAISLQDFDRQDVSAEDVLDVVDATGARIVLLVAQPRVQRSLFAASYRTGVLNGAGYAWLNHLPSQDALISSSSEGEAVDYDAFYGQRGSLGFLDHYPDYESGGAATTTYVDAWAAHGPTAESCVDRSYAPGISYDFVKNEDDEDALQQTGYSIRPMEEVHDDDIEAEIATSSDNYHYCDVDGDPLTSTRVSLFWSDAVLAYAKGVDAAGDSTASAFDAILELPRFEGASGNVTLAPDGDRLGTLELVNLQLVNGDGKRMLLSLPLFFSFAEFVVAGEYPASTHQLVVWENQIIWPGELTQPPDDEPPAIADASEDGTSARRYDRRNMRIFVSFGVGFSTLVLIMCCCMCRAFSRQTKRHRRALVASLNAYEVVEAFDPTAHETRRTISSVIEKRGAGDLFSQGSQNNVVVYALQSNDDDENSSDQAVVETAPLGTTSTSFQQNHRRSSSDGEIKEELKEEEDPGDVYYESLWYWECTNDAGGERDRVLIDKDGVTKWAPYDSLVQDQLSELWHKYLQLPPATKEKLRLQAADAAVAGGMPKASLHKLKIHVSKDKQLEIDVAIMIQRNIKTKSTRRVLRVDSGRAVVLTWYWREHQRHMGKWSQNMTRQGSLWIKYELAEVQRRLSELYYAFRSDSNASPRLWLDQFNELMDDTESSLADAKYEVDVKKMWQRRVDTGFQRPVCVVIEEVASEAEPTRVVRGVPVVRGMPTDIQGNPMRLVPGMLVSIVVEHDSGEWAFGRELSRGNVAEVLDNAGWFPLSSVRKCEDVLDMLPTAKPADFKFLLPPKSWTQAEGLVPLADGHKEHRQIADFFDRRYFKVLAVDRVQNLSLWRAFTANRLTMLEQEGTRDLDRVERWPVFHGTTKVSSARIVAQGFNRDFCSTAAQHGRGVYFATNSEYSCFPKYSPPDDEGIQHVLVSRILVGCYCIGNQETTLPPLRVDRPHHRFDTTVDNMEKPPTPHTS
ncbi:hypothetical protein CTAYLR_008929 [Chrysophaeum taylorii]|uniref:Poly [ADP-ribose] polymerase n=1 Tax=Chrysophaeum taylorii TaxID=2483200 RepID=A0AAD7UJH0_9STRA|nr:hypothetical protein CTAYLR_008929 [Chrysophaeum taylorii]